MVVRQWMWDQGLADVDEGDVGWGGGGDWISAPPPHPCQPAAGASRSYARQGGRRGGL